MGYLRCLDCKACKMRKDLTYFCDLEVNGYSSVDDIGYSDLETQGHCDYVTDEGELNHEGKMRLMEVSI